jgi:hypothetical protein
MPQLIVVALAGAGIYAGFRWVSREFRRALEAAEKTPDEVAQRAGERLMPKDLGTLEWDAETGVYRPSRRG